ncbi:MAG TPA: DoxX family protein [Gemmatimonadaceae bacterium]
MDIALLIARLFLGLGLAAHGAQKLFGWFGGGGVNKTGEFFVKLGWNQGRFFAAGAGLGEFGGGVLVALGFLGPVGPALMILVMLVAALTVHIHNGLFQTSSGWEMPMLYAAGALLLAFTGSGAYSLDHFLGLDWYASSRWSWMAVAAAVILALINVMLRRAPKAAGA